MSKKTYIRWSEIVAIVLISLCLYFSLLHRQDIQDYKGHLVTSWDFSGNPTGAGFSAGFIYTYWTIVSFVTLMIFISLSRIGKYTPKTTKSIRCYNLSLIATELFYAVPFATMIFWNIGGKINPTAVIIATAGCMLLFGTFLISQTEKGWFTEIKISKSETVWKRTHLSVAIGLGISGLSLIIFALILVMQ